MPSSNHERVLARRRCAREPAATSRGASLLRRAAAALRRCASPLRSRFSPCPSCDGAERLLARLALVRNAPVFAAAPPAARRASPLSALPSARRRALRRDAVGCSSFSVMLRTLATISSCDAPILFGDEARVVRRRHVRVVALLRDRELVLDSASARRRRRPELGLASARAWPARASWAPAWPASFRARACASRASRAARASSRALRASARRAWLELSSSSRSSNSTGLASDDASALHRVEQRVGEHCRALRRRASGSTATPEARGKHQQ